MKIKSQHRHGFSPENFQEWRKIKVKKSVPYSQMVKKISTCWSQNDHKKK